LTLNATDFMAICGYKFGRMRPVSQNGISGPSVHAGGASGILLRGCVKKVSSISFRLRLVLLAGLLATPLSAGPVHAEATSYGAQETHWVDPWSAKEAPETAARRH
jgi:hypothetical protein